MSEPRCALVLAVGLGVVAGGLTSAGCASTVLISSADATYVRAQRRLENTAGRVEALGVPRDERVLFMQAEGFYQYRYALA